MKHLRSASDVGSDNGNANSSTALYQVLPLQTLLPTVIIVSLAVLVAVVGNVLVLVSYWLDPKLRIISNVYLCHLAFCDLFLASVSMTFYLDEVARQGYWMFGNVFCKVYLTIDYTLCAQSVYLIVLISWDKLLIVRKGLYYSSSETRTKVYIKIAASWTASVVLYAPAILGFEYWRGYSIISQGECDVEFMRDEMYIVFTAVCEFSVPLLVLVGLNLAVYFQIRKRTRVGPTGRGEGEGEGGGGGGEGSSTFGGRGAQASSINGRPEPTDFQDGYTSVSDSSRMISVIGQASLAAAASTTSTGGTASETGTQLSTSASASRDCSVSMNEGVLTPVVFLSNNRGARPETFVPANLSPIHSLDSEQSGTAMASSNQAFAAPGRKTLMQHAKGVPFPRKAMIGFSSFKQKAATRGLSKAPMPRLPRKARVPSTRTKRLSSTLSSTTTSTPRAWSKVSASVTQLGSFFGVRKGSRLTKSQARDVKAAKSLFILVFAFLVMWAPYTIATILIAFNEDLVNADVYRFFTWLLWFKSAVNPFIYAAGSARFKYNFKRIFRKILCFCKRR